MVAGSDAVYRPLSNCTEGGSFTCRLSPVRMVRLISSTFANQSLKDTAITFENSLLITRYYQITNDGLVLWTRPVDATTALGQGDNRPGNDRLIRIDHVVQSGSRLPPHSI